jgi:hypothetical protein
MTAEGGRPYCAAGGNACDSFQIGLRERPCPEGECGVRPLDWEPFRDSAGRAAQPSESEREGAQMEHNACDRCARDLGDKAYCRQCAGPPPSPPSTGQSREQRLEEALRAADLMLSLLPVRDESEDAARRGVKEQIRRALGSKP